MGTNILKFGLLITAAHFLMASGCGKDKTPRPCANGGSPYSFNVTSEFSPEKEVYNIGDTIYFTSTFPKTLLNLVSNQQVDYSNSFGIGGNIGIGIIDSINHKFDNSVDSFTYINVIGDYNIGLNKSFNFTLKENLTEYQIKVKIVIKRKGNYIFGVSDLGSQGLNGQNCTNAGFNMIVSNMNKHFSILTNANIPGVNLDIVRVNHNYCFRVQ